MVRSSDKTIVKWCEHCCTIQVWFPFFWNDLYFYYYLFSLVCLRVVCILYHFMLQFFLIWLYYTINIPIICHFEHPFLLKLPRFYYYILSHHIRLDNTDKAGLTKVRSLLSILDQKSTFRIICWSWWW